MLGEAAINLMISWGSKSLRHLSTDFGSQNSGGKFLKRWAKNQPFVYGVTCSYKAPTNSLIKINGFHWGEISPPKKSGVHSS